MLSGDLKSLLSLWENLANNQRYRGLVTSMDISVVRERSMHEGVTFLTTVLPKLGKALDKFHSTTEWLYEDGDFETDSLGIPIFLGGAIKLALQGDSLAVDCVRQLTLIFYKLELDFDDQTVQLFLDKFVQTDIEVGEAVLNWDRKETVEILKSMRALICRILCNEDPYEIRPAHGGGATACRTENWEKWHRLRYYTKLDDYFPYADYFFYNCTHLADELQKIEEGEESVPRARVVLVPKDSRGPRVISCEPAELQYIQHGLMSKLYECLEGHHLTCGQVNFTNQEINRNLARVSSKHGDFATIDLQDASDRVSLDLVRLVFPDNWVEALTACRSEETLLPDGRVVKLNKFAPMGSACCFPVEALCFWACAQAVIQIQFPHQREQVFVYGDDIITPSYTYDCVVRGLESIGLLVNKTKSYAQGPFRESCGGDYHLGVDVTPVRVRKYLSRSSTGLATCADLANLFVAKFGYEASIPLIQVIEEAVGYQFPRTSLCYPSTVRSSPCASNDVFFRRRWNVSLQRLEHRILTLRSEASAKQPPDWGELLRKELGRNENKITGEYEHWTKESESSLLPGEYTDIHSVKQKWNWVWLG